MESESTDKKQLIQGILDDAKAESERISSETEKSVQERSSVIENQIQRIWDEAKKNISQKVARIRKINDAAIVAGKRRNMLIVRESLIQEVLERAEKELELMIDSRQYRDILLSWIAEAAIGLNSESAVVNASKNERELAAQVLPDAEKLILELSGRKCTLDLAADDPISGQGIVLRSSDGTVAFSNQVQTRMLRYLNEIREMIYSRLYKEK